MSIDTKNSSRIPGVRNLAGHAKIPVQTAREFLVNLANTTDDGLPFFERRFGLHFKHEVPAHAVRLWMLNIEIENFEIEEDAPLDLGGEEMIRRYWLIPLRNAIRTIWSLPDLRAKQFGVHEILKQFLLRGDRRFRFTPAGESYSDAFSDSLGQPTPLEWILRELIAERAHHLAHVCRNDECANRYFFATRRDQKYCTEECAKPAQREAKLNWWNRSGKKRRAERGTVRKRTANQA